jgi:hypothetical protein
LRAGLFLGILGMGIEGAWIIPPDDIISIAGNPMLELVANKVVGFAAGIVFLLALFLADLALLACFRLKNISLAIQGSFSVFAFLPLIAIPIHALFPPHLGRAGDAWLVWLLIAGFLAWQVTWLGIFLRGGHVEPRMRGRGGLGTRDVAIIVSVVLAIEICGGILFVANLPATFGSNLNEFFWMWF